jgi:putative restriction endonuclease
MSIRLVVAVTDKEWFDHLATRPNLTEVNFWSPGAAPFRALQAGEFFLFKLHAPYNYIVGGGLFAYANTIPCSLAWEAFGEANGAATFAEMRRRIVKYRKTTIEDRSDFLIGCRILTQPFFLQQSDWMPVPSSFARNIVSFKTYSTNDSEGLALWDAIQSHLGQVIFPGGYTEREQEQYVGNEQARYGAPQIIRPRLGQGAFRIVVTDAYERKCAVTRERTLPALEAAHIRPYAEGGAHEPNNGLLLRRDLHALFDSGYVTVSPELKFVVSKRIKEEFENGRDYYALHGRSVTPPNSTTAQPDAMALSWHNETIFLG